MSRSQWEGAGEKREKAREGEGDRGDNGESYKGTDDRAGGEGQRSSEMSWRLVEYS